MAILILMPTTAPKSVLYASAVVLVNDANQIFIAERPKGKLMPGYWEFPGGKLELGETPEVALQREVKEELGITLIEFSPFSFISEARNDHHVIVFVYLCRCWQGNIKLHVHANSAWADIEKAASYRILPSNAALLEALTTIL